MGRPTVHYADNKTNNALKKLHNKLPNFTNNVNSGNLGEVISIVVNDIEESRLLKIDLLGDAIESALSETGGTKDVGLYRTPDHIRQFMTGLIEPTFDDQIFDPACGTGMEILGEKLKLIREKYNSGRIGKINWRSKSVDFEVGKWTESLPFQLF